MTAALALRQVQVYRKESNPVKAHTRCPCCGETELIRVGPESLCSSCDWNSTLQSVQRGEMDHMFRAYKRHFEIPGRNVISGNTNDPILSTASSELTVTKRGSLPSEDLLIEQL